MTAPVTLTVQTIRTLLSPVIPHATQRAYKTKLRLDHIRVRTVPGGIAAMATEGHTFAAQRVLLEVDPVPFDVCLPLTAAKALLAALPRAATERSSPWEFTPQDWTPSESLHLPDLVEFLKHAKDATLGVAAFSIDPAYLNRFTRARDFNDKAPLILRQNPAKSILYISVGEHFVGCVAVDRNLAKPPAADFSWVTHGPAAAVAAA